jgi:hypothetical protein
MIEYGMMVRIKLKRGCHAIACSLFQFRASLYFPLQSDGDPKEYAHVNSVLHYSAIFTHTSTIQQYLCGVIGDAAQTIGGSSADDIASRRSSRVTATTEQFNPLTKISSAVPQRPASSTPESSVIRYMPLGEVGSRLARRLSMLGPA